MAIERFQLPVGGIVADVVRKDIRNLHIGVYPPDGGVRVAAPVTMECAAIHNAVVLRLPWIKRRIGVFQSQQRESPRTYRPGETHWFMGRRVRLRTHGGRAVSKVTLRGGYMDVEVRGEPIPSKVARCIERWRRSELAKRISPMVDSWSEKLGVERPEVGIKQMHTRWGSCSQPARRIWLNLALSRAPLKCLEYVVVHEIAHLLVRAHDANFTSLLNMHLPDWRASKTLLSDLPYSA